MPTNKKIVWLRPKGQSMSWNQRIKQRREELRIKRYELAKNVGVSPATVSDWENAKIKKITTDNLVRVAKALGTTINYLQTGEDEPRFDLPTDDSFDGLTDDQKVEAQELIENFRTDNARALRIAAELNARKKA